MLADYGPEESLNESADIEWVNKVNYHICFIREIINNQFVVFFCVIDVVVKRSKSVCLQ